MRIEGHASTTLQQPGVLQGSEADNHSAYVARDVIGGGIFGKKGDAELGVSLDTVRSRNAAPLIADVKSDPIPDAGYTLTFSARHSMAVDNGFRVGLSADLGWTKVPITRGGDHVSDTAPLYRAAIVPSYRSGAVTVFASVQMTNDILVPNLVTITDDDQDAEATVGGAALIPSAGASVRIGDGVTLTTQIAKPFNTTVEHGPQLDFTLGYELGGGD